ncbi:MAG: hypothetical protein P8Y93_09860, partial [Acidobacteriota bacterium]
MQSFDEISPPGTPEREILERLDFDKLPRHVAIIMDGNGRWAQARHLPRTGFHGLANRTDTGPVTLDAR